MTVRHSTSLSGEPSGPSALRRLDSTATAASVDRLAGDAEVVAWLRAENFTGPAWDFVAQLLWEYGLSVMFGWLRRGVVEQKCREKNIRTVTLPAWVRNDREHCEDIASDVVAEAIDQFQRVVLPRGQWDPRRGASLSTYFIGQCLFRFSNIADRWIRDHQDIPVAVGLGWDGDDTGPMACRADDDEDRRIQSALAQEILDAARTDEGARVLEMVAFGYSYAEIAQDFGRNEKWVTNTVYRERQHIRKTVLAREPEGRSRT